MMLFLVHQGKQLLHSIRDLESEMESNLQLIRWNLVIIFKSRNGIDFQGSLIVRYKFK